MGHGGADEQQGGAEVDVDHRIEDRGVGLLQRCTAGGGGVVDQAV